MEWDAPELHSFRLEVCTKVQFTLSTFGVYFRVAGISAAWNTPPAKPIFIYLRMSVLNPFLASNSKSSVSCVYKPHGSAGVSIGSRSKSPQMPAPISDSDPSACAEQSSSKTVTSWKLHGYRAGRRSDLTVLIWHP